MDKLKPCPFCGGEAYLNIGDIGLSSSVTCKDNCNTKAGSRIAVYVSGKTKDETIKAWNNRSE